MGGRMAAHQAFRAWRARRRGVDLGAGVVLGRGVRFRLEDGGRLAVGDGAVLGDRCRLHVPGGSVDIGAGAVLGERCVIYAAAGVHVGAQAVLADEVVLCDTDRRFDDPERPTRLQPLRTAPIAVGERARLGPRAAVLPGVTIGAGAVVAARSVVTADVGPGASVSGLPARPAALPRRARRARAGRARR
jgi:acetyltransferase-like isoleucine patch superfamily enzyme